MDGVNGFIQKTTFILDIWSSRNRLLWYIGIAIVIGGIILCRIPLLTKKPIVQRVIKLISPIGILCILLCFMFGSGVGVGIGNGNGIGVGNATENVGDGENSNPDEIAGTEALPDVAEEESDKVLNIVVTENKVFVAGKTCENHKDIENAINKLYSDGMIVKVEDHYAYYEPYDEVLTLLEDRSIKYQESCYEDSIK